MTDKQRIAELEAENQQLRDENFHLKQELASLRDDLQAVDTSSITARLRQQRDQYRAERDQLLRTIVEYGRDDVNRATDRYNARRQFFDKSMESATGREAALLRNAIGAAYNQFETNQDATVETLNSLKIPAANFRAASLAQALEAMFNHKRAGALDALCAAVESAIAVSGDARLLCAYIMQDLRISGEVKIRHLERIGLEFFADHIAETPTKLETIKERLELAQSQIASGLTQSEFVAKTGASGRSLERALRLYSAVDVLSREAEDKIGGFLADSK